MKKVKTLLVTAAAALSLSACSLEDVKSLPKEAGEKISEVFNSLLEKVGLKEKEPEKQEPAEEQKPADEQKPAEDQEQQGEGQKEKEDEKVCEHKDENHDGTCDLCGATGLEVIHTDADNDHICDVCGASASEHKDEDHDHNCDICGEVLTQHVDEDNNFVCDICGAALATTSVRLDTEDATLFFALGEEFDGEGVKVIATSEAGSEKELEFELSDPDMTTVGDKTVTVTYGEGENDKLEYTINVSYWSADDLDVFDEASLSGYCPLPYLAGFNMRVEYELDNEGYLDSWWIEADDITLEGYLSYYSKLLDYQGAYSNVNFKLAEVALSDADGFHDLSDVAVFRLTPTRGSRRAFAYDEYFILGINAEGSLIVESRMINAMLDGYFLQSYVADGNYGWSAYADELAPELPNVLEAYYSELSASAFVYPKTLTASVGFVPISLKSANPLVESLDNYDLAWRIYLENALESDYTAYLAELVSAGYEKETYNGVDYYILENDLVGYMEFSAEFFPADAEAEEPSALMIDFFYVAPTSYTNHLTVAAMELAEQFNISEYELYNDFYEDYGCVVTLWSFKDENILTGSAAIEEIARSMMEAGFIVSEGVEFNEDDEVGDYYSVTLTNGVLDVEVMVDAEASQDGSFSVEMDIYDASGFETSNAESALLNAYLAYSQEVGLKGVDYTENQDGSFTFEIVFEGMGDPQNLQYAAETAGTYLAASFEADTSEEGSEANTWVAVFNDIQNAVQVTSVSSISENDLVVSVTFAEHIFITPETTMVEFLTAVNGSAPASTDYTVDANDFSAMAEVSLGELTVEGLKDAAEGLAAQLGSSFVVDSSVASGEDAWLVELTSESTGIQAQILVSVEQGVGTALVYIEFIPGITPESIIQAITSSLFGAETSLGNGYYYDSTYGIYYTTINFGEGDSQYNQWSTNQVSPLVPDTFTRTVYSYTSYGGDDEAVIQRWTDGTIVIDIIGFTSEDVNYCALQVYYAA